MAVKYPNLKTEIVRGKITNKKIVECLNISESAFYYKMRGITEFTLNEAKEIKRILKTDYSLDYLFKDSGGADAT